MKYFSKRVLFKNGPFGVNEKTCIIFYQRRTGTGTDSKLNEWLKYGNCIKMICLMYKHGAALCFGGDEERCGFWGWLCDMVYGHNHYNDFMRDAHRFSLYNSTCSDTTCAQRTVDLSYATYKTLYVVQHTSKSPKPPHNTPPENNNNPSM